MAVAPQASRRLLDSYYTRVLGIAYQTVGDAALAVRAVETIFDQLLQEADADVIDVWQITVEVLQSYIRRGYVVAPLASDAAGWQASLLDALAQLDPDARIVLLLRYHERLSHEELATILQVDARVVRDEVARARSELMDVLGLHDAMR